MRIDTFVHISFKYTSSKKKGEQIQNETIIVTIDIENVITQVNFFTNYLFLISTLIIISLKTKQNNNNKREKTNKNN